MQFLDEGTSGDVSSQTEQGSRERTVRNVQTAEDSWRAVTGSLWVAAQDLYCTSFICTVLHVFNMLPY